MIWFFGEIWEGLTHLGTTDLRLLVFRLLFVAVLILFVTFMVQTTLGRWARRKRSAAADPLRLRAPRSHPRRPPPSGPAG